MNEPVDFEGTPEKSVHDHAVANGQLRVGPKVPDADPYHIPHMIAQTMHGWLSHAHHWGIVMMSEDDYRKALAAAACGEIYGPADRNKK